MFKKLVFIALGITIIAAKKSASLLSANRWLSEGHPTEADAGSVRGEAGQTEAESGTANQLQDSGGGLAPSVSEEERAEPEADDLTKITGIGPTYAARLRSAGIITFQDLANSTPEILRQVAQVRGESADTAAWIAQAEEEL